MVELRGGSWRALALLASVAFVAPPLGILLADHLFGPAQRVHLLPHLVSEMVGSCIALGVAGLVAMRARINERSTHLLWVSASLAGMGIVDAVHGLAEVGLAWSWLRHGATLLGGMLFALVWAPVHPSLLRRSRSLPLLVFLAGLAAAGFVWWLDVGLPLPWTAEGYTWATKITNAVGGVGFLLGGLYFARCYLAHGEEENLALAVYAALFGSAGLTFGFSHVWSPGWWWLHACRLVAYLVVLLEWYRVVGRSFDALGESATELERRVEARTRELAESRARLDAITANAPVAIIYVDADLIVRFANPAVETWSGRPHDQVVGYPLSDVLAPRAFREREHFLRAALRGDRLRFEGRPPHETIGPRHTESTYIPEIDGRGNVVGVYIFVVDVTDLKNTQLALAAAQAELQGHAAALERLVAERTATLQDAVEELEAFSYSIAHDMRAPLRAMQGYAQLLGQGQPLDEQGQDFVKRIRASAERMDQLIRDVLDYSRVVRDELPVTNVEVGPLVRGILDSYPNLHNDDVTVDLVEPLPDVRANPAALTQVFSNLLGNAVKFVAQGVRPRVVVRSEARSEAAERWIRFWVEDNGIGMTAEDTARIFGMFQRLRAAGAYAGTGMGLAIVKKAVERMGGRLGVESEPGRGSRFWFELRAAR